MNVNNIIELIMQKLFTASSIENPSLAQTSHTANLLVFCA